METLDNPSPPPLFFPISSGNLHSCRIAILIFVEKIFIAQHEFMAVTSNSSYFSIGEASTRRHLCNCYLSSTAYPIT